MYSFVMRVTIIESTFKSVPPWTNQHDTVNILTSSPEHTLNAHVPQKSLYRRKRTPLIEEHKNKKKQETNFFHFIFSFGLVSVNYPIFQCFLKSNIFSTNIYPKSNLLFADLTQNKKNKKRENKFKTENPFSQDIKLEYYFRRQLACVSLSKITTHTNIYQKLISQHLNSKQEQNFAATLHISKQRDGHQRKMGC